MSAETSRSCALNPEPDIGLDELPLRASGRVVRLLATADASEQELVLRLLEIGFLPGESVRVIAQGHPGRDPLAVRVGHTTFALRRFEAARIRVVPEHPGGRSTP
jgi:ferrous iron transport protein A